MGEAESPKTGGGDERGSVLADRIARIRAFSRAYTRHIGLLQERLLRSPFTLSEGRVIWELAHRGSATAADLARDLGLDPGYVSRLVRRLEESGHLTRRPDPDDGRSSILELSDDGRAAFADIDAASRGELAELLSPLPDVVQERLAAHLDTARRVLDGTVDRSWLLRPPSPGDLGWIVQAHGELYAREHGFDRTFEALVAEIVAEFARADEAGQRCWIAERHGRNAGSVMVVRRDDDTAQLRCLIVDPAARGLGIGRRLVRECLDFARRAGYGRMVLWTVDILPSARRIYEAEGFVLTESTPERLWGRDLVSQQWGRDL